MFIDPERDRQDPGYYITHEALVKRVRVSEGEEVCANWSRSELKLLCCEVSE